MSDQNAAETSRPGDQPHPIPNDRPDAQAQLMEKISQRRELGKSRYGTYLQPHNGRDAARDLLEELLDAAVYWTQIEMERDALSDRGVLRVIVDQNLQASLGKCGSCKVCDHQTDAVMAIIDSLLTTVTIGQQGTVPVDRIDLADVLNHSSFRDQRHIAAADRLAAALNGGAR